MLIMNEDSILRLIQSLYKKIAFSSSNLIIHVEVVMALTLEYEIEIEYEIRSHMMDFSCLVSGISPPVTSST